MAAGGFRGDVIVRGPHAYSVSERERERETETDRDGQRWYLRHGLFLRGLLFRRLLGRRLDLDLGGVLGVE